MAKIDPKLARKAGLDPSRIQTHANRIGAALRGEIDTHIPVHGACTVDNGGIVSWATLESWLADTATRKGEMHFSDAHQHWAKNFLVTMVPAAGAASRFLGELRKFTDEVELKVPALANGITKKQNKALPNAETFPKLVESIAMKPAIASLADKVEEQEYIEVVREYIRIGVLLGVFYDVEFSSDKQKSKVKGVDSTQIEWRNHWSDLFESNSEFEEGCDQCGEECEGCSCGEQECGSNCDCDSECGEGCGCECAEEGDDSCSGVGVTSVLKCYAAAKAILNLYAGEPKALVPTTNEGDSFLRLKLVEQVSTLRSGGNVLVVPAGQKQKVTKIVKDECDYLVENYANIFDLEGTHLAPSWLNTQKTKCGRWSVMEQGADLSTIRFGENGEPVMEKGQYSLVAAGHGELVHLFSKVSQDFPSAECLHVRNIDNVVGASGNVCIEIAQLSDSFRLIRDALEFLRFEVGAYLASSRSKKDAKLSSLDVCLALDFLGMLAPQHAVEAALSPCFTSEGDFDGVSAGSVYGVLAALFHWPELSPRFDGKELWKLIDELISRPLSVFGVVKKEDADVGGGPVFIKLPDGAQVKLCMEMPHANAQDSRKYFGAGGACTHFNPVLTFFELRTHTNALGGKKARARKVDFRRLFDDRFWMLSRKEHQGKPVCYHETVLYELIGNSATTNLVFVEVPRSLFVPHKTIFESLGRTREFYGFAETLGKRNGS